MLPAEEAEVPVLKENGEAEAVDFTAPKLNVGAELAAEAPNGVCEVDTGAAKGLCVVVAAAAVPNAEETVVVVGLVPNENPDAGAEVVVAVVPNNPKGNEKCNHFKGMKNILIL